MLNLGICRRYLMGMRLAAGLVYCRSEPADPGQKLTLFVAALLLAIPLMDMVAIMCRRLRARHEPSRHQHIHHLIMRHWRAGRISHRGAPGFLFKCGQ